MNKKNGNQILTPRRDFLKTGTAALAASVVSAPGLSLARSAHAGGSDTVKIGLIGCGGRGTGAAGNAMNTSSGAVNLVAVGDAFEDRMNGCLGALAGAHGEKVQVGDDKKFVGYDAYQRVLNEDIDLVILATPPGFRPLHFEKAIEQGKHVFMEKPVAVDAPGVRRVLKANEKAKQEGLLVQVGLQRRHERSYMETIRQLKEGAIGEINLMRCYWNGDGVWVRARKEEYTELEYQMRNWYYFNWLCGDHIDEQHIHNIDVCNWLMDGYPVKANGMGGREVRDGKEHGQIFDHHFVEFTYEDGTKLFSQCRHIKDAWRSVSEHAHGSEGYCNISAGKMFDLKGAESWSYGSGGRGGHQQEHHDLFKDLTDGRIPNEGDYGALSTMTSIFGRMATYTGKEITWDQAFNSQLTLCDVDSLTSMDNDPPVKPDADGRYPVPVPGVSWDDVL